MKAVKQFQFLAAISICLLAFLQTLDVHADDEMQINFGSSAAAVSSGQESVDNYLKKFIRVALPAASSVQIYPEYRNSTFLPTLRIANKWNHDFLLDPPEASDDPEIKSKQEKFNKLSLEQQERFLETREILLKFMSRGISEVPSFLGVTLSWLKSKIQIAGLQLRQVFKKNKTEFTTVSLSSLSEQRSYEQLKRFDLSLWENALVVADQPEVGGVIGLGVGGGAFLRKSGLYRTVMVNLSFTYNRRTQMFVTETFLDTDVFKSAMIGMIPFASFNVKLGLRVSAGTKRLGFNDPVQIATYEIPYFQGSVGGNSVEIAFAHSTDTSGNVTNLIMVETERTRRFLSRSIASRQDAEKTVFGIPTSLAGFAVKLLPNLFPSKLRQDSQPNVAAIHRVGRQPAGEQQGLMCARLFN